MKTPKAPKISLFKPKGSELYFVRIRVSFNGRADLYPNVSVEERQWDARLQRVKHGCRVNGVLYSVLNKRITDCLDFIQTYCDNAQLREDTTASAEELKKQYNAANKRTDSEQSDEFFFLLEEYIEKQNRDRNWSAKYHEQWLRFKNDLKEYRPKLKFSDLSDSMMAGYVIYLAKRMSNDKIKEYIKKFREFVSFAKKKRMPINSEFYDFKPVLKNRQKQVAYLKPDEIQRIIALDYSAKPSLDRVRDIFIFQCCTSLRFSDVSALTKDNIRKNDNGKIEVLLVTRKDKGMVWFELNKVALKIYDKYKDCNYDGNKLFHVACGTDFRKFLHQIGKDAAIEGEVTTVNFKLKKEEITTRKRSDINTHDARRTFIVTAINGGASPDEIALYTSHSEVQQMMPYLSISDEGKKRVNKITETAFGTSAEAKGKKKKE